MKKLGVIKESTDFINVCRNSVSHNTLTKGMNNDNFKNIALGHEVVSFKYDDFTESESERVFADKLTSDSKFKNYVLSESTDYNGKIVNVYGVIADDIVKCNENERSIADTLGVDLDSSIEKMEYHQIQEAISNLKINELKHYKICNESENWLYSWLVENGKGSANKWLFDKNKCFESFITDTKLDKKLISEDEHGYPETYKYAVERAYEHAEEGVKLVSNLYNNGLKNIDDIRPLIEKIKSEFNSIKSICDFSFMSKENTDNQEYTDNYDDAEELGKITGWGDDVDME